MNKNIVSLTYPLLDLARNRSNLIFGKHGKFITLKDFKSLGYLPNYEEMDSFREKFPRNNEDVGIGEYRITNLKNAKYDITNYSFAFKLHKNMTHEDEGRLAKDVCFSIDGLNSRIFVLNAILICFAAEMLKNQEFYKLVQPMDDSFIQEKCGRLLFGRDVDFCESKEYYVSPSKLIELANKNLFSKNIVTR